MGTKVKIIDDSDQVVTKIEFTKQVNGEIVELARSEPAQWGNIELIARDYYGGLV